MSKTNQNLSTLIDRAQLLLRVIGEEFIPDSEVEHEIEKCAEKLTDYADTVLFGLNQTYDLARVMEINHKDKDVTLRSIERGRHLAAQYQNRRVMPRFSVGPKPWGEPVYHDKAQAFAFRRIDDIGLSGRVCAILYRENFSTVGQILSYTLVQLRKVPGMGDKSIEELIYRLMCMGLKLRES